MPTYVYRCRGCGDRFEVVQSITAAPGATCERCGSPECTRVITGGTFHLKGSGWHSKDYAPKPLACKPGDRACEAAAEVPCQGECAGRCPAVGH